MKTISAVIITINNKDVVNAIDSVRSSCSQIVVVDTGSTQEHLGFLKQIEGIELHYFKWCEDFSAARNYGLQFANGDYILTIDSDEVLEKQIHADMLTADIY
ncbi:MAG: glycosyltransferase [Ignavibacteria bacterium]|nr:glycosyltransferase [Ignavibacteria bacterium]